MKRLLLSMATMALTLLVSSGVVLADFVAGPDAAEPTAPKPAYSVTPLGTLGGGQSIARDINDSGQVVGQVQTTSGQRAFLWENGQMTDLGTLPGGTASFGRGINDSGQVVGFSRTSSTANPVHGFLWKSDPMTDLGTLTEVSDSGTTTTFSNSEAWHINDSGVAVGRSFNSGSQGRAVLWENGQIKNLGKPLNTSYSEAWSINDKGQVVGEAGIADQQAKAFLYDNATDGVTDIDASLEDSVFPYPYSEAMGINDRGQVVGWSYKTTTPAPEGTAFLYEKGDDGTATVSPLNPLDGDLYSRARDIDESGRAVGWSRGTDGDDAQQFSAVRWEDGTVEDLNDLIPADSGWKLTDAYAINEKGQIVGAGYHYDDAGNKGQLQAFLLTDTTPPALSVTHTADGSNGWNTTPQVTLNVSASDSGSGLPGAPNCTDGTTDLTLTEGTAGNWTASVSGEGTHIISCSVRDNAGNSTSATDTVEIDTKAPSVSGCSVTPSRLKPPNHKLVTVTATAPTLTDSGGSGPDGLTLFSVTSSQPDSGLGPDDVPNDIQGWTTGTNLTDGQLSSGQLRAERYGDARIYTLTYQGKDVADNTAECKATVTVPKGG